MLVGICGDSLIRKEHNWTGGGQCVGVRGYDHQFDLVDALKENTEDCDCFWLSVVVIKCTGWETCVCVCTGQWYTLPTYCLRRAMDKHTQRTCSMPLLTPQIIPVHPSPGLCVRQKPGTPSPAPSPENQTQILLCVSYQELNSS